MQQDNSHILSYEKGLNLDANTESNSGFYNNCENFRINSSAENLTFGLTNDVKNKFYASLPVGHIIIGTCFVRDIILLYTTKTESEEGGQGWIYKTKINKETSELEYLTLVYTHADLLFSTQHPIEALGYYESDGIIRNYFSDYKNSTRGFNIQTINNGDNIESVSIFPSINLKAPIIDKVGNSGKLEVGIYEYFVWYTTKDGKESLYSPNSIQIHIVDSLESVANTTLYKGSDEYLNADKTITSKSVKVSIDNLDVPTNLFNKVTLGCIYKTNLNSTPRVIKVEEKIYNDSSVSFSHTGFENSISDISYGTYSINSFPFYTNKTFAIKGSALTVSNIKNQLFDINWNCQCHRYKTDLTTHDPFKNPYNDESGQAYDTRPSGTYSNWYNEDQFKFQSDGSTIGGQSLDGSIKYTFTLQQVGIEPNNNVNYYLANPNILSQSFENGHIVNNQSFISYHSPYNRIKKGYKREEIYRFGLVGKKKGRYSFVKYIGDIKMPSISDIGITEAGTTFGFNNFPVSINFSGSTIMFALGLKFTINVPSNVDIDSYEIVRVPRTFDNRTRICSGVISKFYETTGGETGSGIYYPIDNLNDIRHYYLDGSANTGANINDQVEFSRRDLVGFYSPEVTYDFDYPKDSGLNKLKVVGIYNSTTKQTIDSSGVNQLLEVGDGNNNNGINNTHAWFSKVKATMSVAQPDKEFNIENIKDFAKIAPGYYNTPKVVGDLKVRNYCTYSDIQTEPTSGTNRTAYGGTCLICKLDANDLALFDDNNTQTVYTNYLTTQRGKLFYIDFIKLNKEQYGGVGEEVLAYNEFISITNSINSTVVETDVYGGDIYVGQWEFMKTFWDNTNGVGDNNSFYENVVLPIESTINFDLNSGLSLRRGSTFDHDNSGVGENYRSQEDGMFKYNSVFSSELMSRPYFTKPIYFKEELLFDVRTYLSNNKILNETEDSWSKFAINSFIDADANLGAINRTFDYLNNVFFLQDNGVGYLPINESAATTTTDGNPVKLGTAQGFGEHVYVSKNNGCIHQWGCKVLPDGLYYYDGLRKTFNKLNGTSPENLSIIKGANTFFQNIGYLCNYKKEEGGDNPILGKGVHLGYNQKYEELYITVLGGNRDTELANRTLVYNSKWESFRSFYSFSPPLYIDDQRFLLAPSTSQSNNIYVFNSGTNGILFGQNNESVIEFLITDLPIITKILRYINYDIIVKNSNGDVLNEGLSSIRIYNDYQDTGKVSLVNRQKNRFNTWKIFKLPRNQNSANRISRMRNDWFKVALYFNNNNNKQINLERIFSFYITQPK